MKIILNTDRKALAEACAKKETAFQFRAQRASPPVSVDEKERSIQFVLSDETQDHCGDIIRAAGWDLGVFNQNPVLPWCHNYDDPPIGGWQDVVVKGSQLLGRAQFAKPEDYPFADTVFRLAARGFLRGVSVGFNPKKWNDIRDDRQSFVGVEFLEQILLECSACTMPCNPNALARAAKDGTVSKRELAEVVTRRVLANLGEFSPADLTSGKTELFSRLQKMETEIETLKAILADSSDAGGQAAASHAPASAEAAKILDLIAELKQISA